MNYNKEAFVIDAVRTPIGKLNGSLSNIRADDLAAFVIKSLIDKYPDIAPAEIEDIMLGCANQAGEDNRNVARMASLLAGMPVSVPAETINRLCASGMSACIHAARAIRCEEGDFYIAGGIEHMTRAPYVLSKSAAPYGRDVQLYDTTFGWRFVNPKIDEKYGTEGMGQTAENLVAQYSISREDQDKFAEWSQQKAAKAQSSGRFAKEIIPIEIPVNKKETRLFEHDEFIRPDTNREVLAKLKPAFKANGSVTAGNASGLNDGAAALLISSYKGVRHKGLEPLARFVSWAVVGVEPRIMGIGPVEASKKALNQAGLSLKKMDIIEINEAFAAQVLACTRSLGLDDADERINPNGGAIALGHPLGMSGARLIQTAALQLQETQKRYALCTMCVGVGQGYAVVLERV
ncbi:MAG: 3-oxoadipyl-CoA thiolase [Chitinophagales bacterium]|nr:3-oxoadipyl-CoA thiolase [Bacteroidota bacterium]MCB9042937.1 3-oxoadipyl-CoA thiolase [Chitinophagales bacterium]